MAQQTKLDEALQATEAAGALCWACNSAVSADAHFCPNCGKVQRAVPTDHFCFFGLPRKLNINVAELEKEFYRLSRKLHPDVYARASANEQEWSLEKSSQLNDGYRTLKEPIARTHYLLELEGVKFEEQSSAATEAARDSGELKKQIVPPELLEEVFELNIQLQEMKMARDMGEEDAATIAELESAKRNFEERLAGMDAELKSLWNHWDSGVDSNSDDTRNLAKEKMVALLNKRSYIRNLVRDVTQALKKD